MIEPPSLGASLDASFAEQIHELIRANGWEGQLQVELVPEVGGGVRIRLSQDHGVAPLDIVNDYRPDTHPLEQVQQECLRALRTGRAGI